MVNPISSAPYNISLSLNFTSFLNFPARLLSKLRHSDDILPAIDQDIPKATFSTLQHTMMATPLPTPSPILSQPQPKPELPMVSFPGPWGFLTSWYAVGLLVTAVLMSRIQNVVLPPRSPWNQINVPRNESSTRRRVRSLYSRFLPLDFSKTSTRLIFHLPTLYCLLKMLLLWSLILLQTSDILNLPHSMPISASTHRVAGGWTSTFDINQYSWMRDLSAWSSSVTMEQVCWRTFCSICAACCIEALVRGFDGPAAGLVHANSSPLNLIGYAFLFHIYSAPITHVNHFDDLPSRPDKHVVITMTIPLIQLTLFHVLSIFKRWSHNRLLPTAISSFLSLIHFHLTLWTRSRKYLPRPQFTDDSDPKLTNTVPPHYQRHQLPYASYPLLNFVPNVFETLLLATTLLTVALNALTQLLLTGSVDRPLAGLGLTGFSNVWSVPWDEDFSVLLLRVGTASLEATGLRGWANEVGAIMAPAGRDDAADHGQVGLGRMGVVWMQSVPGPLEPHMNTNASHLRRRHAGPSSMASTRNQPQGLSREIRSVLSTPSSWSSSETTSSSSSWWIPNVGPHTTGLLGNWRWLSELLRYVKTIWAAFKGIIALAWAKLRGHDLSRNKLRHHRAGDHALSLNTPQQNRSKDHGSSWEDEVYEKFLSGDVEGDDEDDEWTGDSPSSDSDDDRPIGELYSRSSSVDPTSEAMSLYSDWLPLAATSSSSSQREGTPSPSEEMGSSGGIPAPVLLAHLTHSGSSPLTRRAYDQLLDATLVQSTKTRRKAKSPQQSDEAHRNCVVCTIEPRQIICWPCRCLAVCDECRECLVSNSGPSKHRCPCCRRVVEGYSRIFIP